MADKNKLIPIIKRWEGGYGELKNDHGGATNSGVYQLLSIARNFKTQYLCSRNRKGAVMLAILEWIGLNCSSELNRP